MALYHKHRPQTFGSVVGQDHIIKTITNQIKNGKVAHAYLFSGPRGIGKTTTARLLAKALNCEERKDKTPEPCDSCSSCNEISGSRSIDVIEIDAASHTGVDNVRENIIENAQFKPTKSPYKVFIIDEVHMLSTSAFNALLKTLEEPPEHVVFVLATTEPQKLPETIISRCQHFNFKKVAYDVLKKHLGRIAKEEGVKIDKSVMDRIVNKSDGCVRDAVSLLDQIMAVGEKNITDSTASIVLPTSNVEETLRFVSTLINKQVQEGLDIISNLAEGGTRFVQFADDVIELLRVMMIMKATGGKSTPGVDLSDKVKKELKKLGEQVGYSSLVSLIDLIMKRRQEIQTAPLPQLPLELVIIEWTGDNDQQSPPKADQPLAETIDNETEEEPEVPSKTKRITEKVKKVKNLVTRDREPVCSVEEARSKWPELLKTINGDSPSLVFILKMAEVLEINGSTIKLAVQYGFHQDKLSEKKCQRKIESLLSKLLNKKVKIGIVVAEKKAAKQEDAELQELATALGGEVVQ